MFFVLPSYYVVTLLNKTIERWYRGGATKSLHPICSNAWSILFINFCTIRGVQYNFQFVERHLSSFRSNLLFLTETRVLERFDSWTFEEGFTEVIYCGMETTFQNLSLLLNFTNVDLVLLVLVLFAPGVPPPGITVVFKH